MAAPPIESVLHLGFRFEPTPNQAVSYYLPRLIAGEPMHAAIRPFIHDTNVYACAPDVLAAQFRPTPIKDDRFFFTTVERQKHSPGKDVRYVRVAGPGSWRFQRSDDVRDGSNVKVGEVRKFRYRYKSGVATEWLMEEYSCACGVEDAVVGDKERVFCRIYVSPNAGANSAARQESAAFFAPPAPPPIVPEASKKRPAAPPTAKPPCPKRIRPAPVSPIRAPSLAGYRTSFPSPRPCAPPSGMVPMMQPARSLASAPARPSQQLAHVELVAAARQLPPRPSVPAPAVKQEPGEDEAVDDLDHFASSLGDILDVD